MINFMIAGYTVCGLVTTFFLYVWAYMGIKHYQKIDAGEHVIAILGGIVWPASLCIACGVLLTSKVLTIVPNTARKLANKLKR